MRPLGEYLDKHCSKQMRENESARALIRSAIERGWIKKPKRKKSLAKNGRAEKSSRRRVEVPMSDEMKKKIPVFLNRFQLAEESKIPRSRIRRAAERGVLTPDAFDGAGAPLFAASRVLEIARSLQRPEVAA